MAERIGAIIELDGEKEFKQGVTDCNKSLSTLKSEMGLVKAQCEGQANTLESLRKKHVVLTKTLEEQKNKEEAVRRGLEHAEQSYKSVGDGLDILKKNLSAATVELEQMRQSSDTSRVDLLKQEKAVEDLSLAVAKGEKNYNTAGNRVKDWQAKLNTAEAQVIKATKAVNENAAYMEEAEQATDKCATSIDKFGKATQEATEVSRKWTEVLRDKVISSVADMAKDAMSSMVTGTLELQDATNQLQASTGASAGEMQKFKSVLQDVYAGNYGESFEDVADATEKIKQTLGNMDPTALQKTTESAITLRDVFDMDYQEQLRAVKTLMKNFGIEADEAYNLIAQGAQQGLNKNDDLLDVINEYSSYYAGAGRSADDFFNSLKNGAEEGTFSVDKLGDAYKEFTIRAKDTANTTTEAYKILGLNADNMRAQFAKGGESAKQATDVIVRALFNVENDVKRNQAGVDLFGTMWEDLGEKGIRALTQMNGGISSSYDAMSKIKNIKYNSVTNQLTELGRKFKSAISDKVEDFLPVITGGLEAVIDSMDILIPMIAGAGAAFVTYKVAAGSVTLFTEATKMATEGQTLFNAVLGANPLIKVISVVIAAGTALIAYASNLGEVSRETEILTEANARVVESANNVTESVNNTIASYSDSTAEMQAQGEYAKILAGRIEDLAGKGSLNNTELSIMQGYIAELNGIVPGLNLAYDEQAQKLNMSTDAMYDNIEASQKQIAQQAAQEYAIELIKKKTELEIEAIKLENEASDVNERRNQLLEEENDLVLKGLTPLAAWWEGKSNERKEYQALTDAQEENSEAVEANQKAKEELAAEEEAVKIKLEEMGVSWGLVTEAVNANSEASENAAAAQQNTTEMMMASAGQIAETYSSLKESVTGALESQMNMFEEFNAGTEISTEQLLSNMQSQIDGVTNWANNMAELSDRGINQNLLQYLADMGPEGASYVAAFAQMSDEELKKASDMWSESLDMKSGVESSVNGMLDSLTTSLSGGTERVKGAMQQVGADSISGLTEKLQSGQLEVKTAGDGLGESVIDGAKEGAGTHSPSWKTAEVGRDINEGLIQGINETKDKVSSTMQRMLNDIIKNTSINLNAKKFVQDGRSIPSGLMQGINAGKGSVINSIKSLTTQVQNTSRTTLNASRFTQDGRQVSTGIANGINAGRMNAVTSARSLADSTYTTASNIRSLYSAGYNVSLGLASGIRAGRSAVINAAASVCEAAIREARSRLRIHSPSQVFAEIGEYTAEGFGVGYRSRMGRVNSMIRESLDYTGMSPNVSNSNIHTLSQAGNEGKLIIELPIYNNGVYSRTEIVEIARNGITRMQNNRLTAKGVLT